MTVHEDVTATATAELERSGNDDETECGKQSTKEMIVKAKGSVDGSQMSVTENKCGPMKLELNTDQKRRQIVHCTEVSKDKNTLSTSSDLEEETISSKCEKSTCEELFQSKKVSSVQADSGECYSPQRVEGKVKMVDRESADKSAAILKVEADDTKNIDDITRAMAKTSLGEGENKSSICGEKDSREESEEEEEDDDDDDSSCEFLSRAPTGGRATVYPTPRDIDHFDFDLSNTTRNDTFVMHISQKRSMDEDDQPLRYRKPTENDEMQYLVNEIPSPAFFSTCEPATMTGGTIIMTSPLTDNSDLVLDIFGATEQTGGQSQLVPGQIFPSLISSSGVEQISLSSHITQQQADMPLAVHPTTSLELMTVTNSLPNGISSGTSLTLKEGDLPWHVDGAIRLDRAKLNDVLLEDDPIDFSLEDAWSPSSGLGSSISTDSFEVPSDGYGQIPSPGSFYSSATDKEVQDLSLSYISDTEDTQKALEEFEKVLETFASKDKEYDFCAAAKPPDQQKMVLNERIPRFPSTFRPIVPKPTDQTTTDLKKPDQQPVACSVTGQGVISLGEKPERSKELEEEERRALTWISSLTSSDLMKLDKDEDSLIHIAVLQQELYILKALLARLERENVDLKKFINKEDRDNMTALYMAIVMDLEEDKASVQEEIIEELLKHGADVDILSRREYQARGVVYESPLHVIARRGKPRILNQLLRYTSNINKTNNILETPVHCAVNACSSARDNNMGHYEVLTVLKEHNANFAAKTRMNKTILHLVAERGDHKLMKYLLNLLPHEVIAAIINEQDDNENTALHLATGFELQPTAERVLAAKHMITDLVKKGADVKLRNRQNKTALNFVPKPLMGEIGELFKRKTNISGSYQ